ncbi:MAG: hypothetical protein K9K39_07225 [Desulfohalobiaceae bacterium]|nr:hypothetical protein [Desulfohalobiaceae bacterium]
MKGKSLAITILAAILLGALFPLRVSQADNLAQDYHETPPFITTAVSPKVMLVMGRNHKLFYEAYNDASDLNGDGVIDVTYKPDEIDYYGYFDSYKCYQYDGVENQFEPSCDSNPDTKTCEGFSAYEWSGDFLNYLTMSRMDALRKVLYGGKRSTDEKDETVLERAYIPQDAHSWGKSYNSTQTDGYDISKYSPLGTTSSGERHLFASTTLDEDGDGDGHDDPPLLLVGEDTSKRVWEWVAKERPVCDGTVTTDRKRTVRVEVGVCSESDTSGVYSGSMSYNSSYSPKPVGLLQRYGKDGDMHFGLLTGSYTNNISGGVLRKNIGSIEDEIDPNTGEFTSSQGIIHTIDHLRIINFDYSNHEYEGGWYTEGPMSESVSDPDAPDFPDWGNPTAEMLYEALNYFAGDAGDGSTTSFTDGVSDGNDEGLNLPHPNWQDPYNSTDYCAEAHILTISDIYPSFDSDEVPGTAWGPKTPKKVGSASEQLNAEAIGDEIFSNEFNGTQNRFIGCSDCASHGDYSCSPKSVDSLGDIRGLCPDEPTKQGSYYSASVAHYGRTNDLNNVQGNQTITNYMVGLSSPRPRIEIPVGDNTITIVPFAKSVNGSSYNITPDEDNDYQPTNTIVDYFVESISPTQGSFRINFEDVEQGADHDMDAIVRYTYKLLDSSGAPVSDPTQGDKVQLTVESEYAAGSITQHLGYIISGTQNDGTYLVVRDNDLDAQDGNGVEIPEYSADANATDVAYFLDSPETEDDLGLSDTRTFEPSTTEAATTLKNPLWYAAKWGGFESVNNNGKPDQQEEWDADGDGKPDSYFYVQNPLRLEDKLNKVFAEILQRTSGGTSIASLTERTTSGALISQAVFYPQKRINGHKINWLGYLYSYWFLNKVNVQNLREDTPASKSSHNPEDKKLDILGDRILQFNSTASDLEIDVYNSSTNGSRDEQVATYDSLEDVSPVWEAGEHLQERNASKRTIYGVTQNGNMTKFNTSNAAQFEQNLGNDQDQFPSCLLNGTTPQYSKLIRFLRGEHVAGCRSRQTGNGVWKLGDIVHSTPETVTYPDEGYSLVFTGANDGMLHAFRLGKLKRQKDDLQPTKLCNDDNDCGTDKLGREEWAFIPKNAMPYLRYMAFPSYSHINSVDLKPYVIHKKGSNQKILIGGMRFGGACGADAKKFDAVHPPPDTCTNRGGSDCTGRSAYFALDVSDPQNPEYLWSFSPSNLGFSYSGPAYIHRKNSNDNWKHYVMFASGPTSYDGYSAQPLTLFIRDLMDGTKVRTETTQKKNAFGGRLFTDGLDVDGDYQTDYVLMGYTEKSSESTTAAGGVMKIWTGATSGGDPYPDGWDYDNYLNLEDTSVVSRVVPMRCFGQWYIYFGTGRYFHATDNDMDVNFLYGLPFTCNPETNDCDTGSINSAHNSEDMNCTDIYQEGSNPNQAGWKRKLKEGSGDYMMERNYADPSATEFNVVFFNPAMPTANPCEFGGKSRSFALNCVTGWGLMNDDCSDKYTVSAETFKYLVQLSGGDIKQYSSEDFASEGVSTTTPGVPSEEGGIPMTGSSTSGDILLWLEK